MKFDSFLSFLQILRQKESIEFFQRSSACGTIIAFIMCGLSLFCKRSCTKIRPVFYEICVLRIFLSYWRMLLALGCLSNNFSSFLIAFAHIRKLVCGSKGSNSVGLSVSYFLHSLLFSQIAFCKSSEKLSPIKHALLSSL